MTSFERKTILAIIQLTIEAAVAAVRLLRRRRRRRPWRETCPFGDSARVPLWVLGSEGEALDPRGEVKLAHLLAQAAVSHVGLGGEIHRCLCGAQHRSVGAWVNTDPYCYISVVVRSPRSQPGSGSGRLYLRSLHSLLYGS